MKPGDSNVISIDGLKKTYGHGHSKVEALRGVSLAIGRGEWVSIMGPSGSGKTTLLNVVGALDQGYMGSVRLLGEELRRLSDRKLSRLRGQKLGFVFQQFNLLPHLTVLENVAVPAFFSRKQSKQTRDRAVSLLDRVGLSDKHDALPDQLSGGQQQRVAIARALLNQTRVLLCDEPTGALDKASGAQIMDLFGSLNRDEGLTLIVVTHQPDISAMGDRVVHLEDGLIVSDEATSAVEEAQV